MVDDILDGPKGLPKKNGINAQYSETDLKNDHTKSCLLSALVFEWVQGKATIHITWSDP